jgi:hypothetical protein
MTTATITIVGVPDAVNERLNALVPDVRFWVEKESERLTPAETRDALTDIEQRAIELLSALDRLDHAPRAHVVASLPLGGLQHVRGALAALHAAALAGKREIPPSRRGNVQVGVPRYAAERVVAIFRAAGLSTWITNNETRPDDSPESPITRALIAVMEAAGYPLAASTAKTYIRGATRNAA